MTVTDIDRGYSDDLRFLMVSLWIVDARTRGMSSEHICQATGLTRSRVQMTMKAARTIPDLPLEIQTRTVQRALDHFARDFGLPMRMARPRGHIVDTQDRAKRRHLARHRWGFTKTSRFFDLYSKSAVSA